MALEILGETWNISQRGEEIITQNNTIKDKATLLKNALNSDLKETGASVLNKLQNKPSVSQIVLQIQKIRNIAAPKANEKSQAAPRMLKLVLTDGDTYIQAIETAPISSLNLDKTPPGSKLLIHLAKLSSGYLLLDSNNCSWLGGQVPALYEKWELAKSVQFHTRQSSSSDGPPAWVNFGKKIQSDIQDKPFKSLDNKNAENKESSKFEMQRQDAIAEATSGAIKKVFGGGIKQTVHSAPVSRNKPDFSTRDRRNAKSKPIEAEVEDKPQKPPERVSLFDFLEDKLPSNESNVTHVESVKPVVNYYNNPKVTQKNFQNNRSQSYNKDQNSFYRAKPQQVKTEENSFYRGRNEVKPQTRVDDSSFFRSKNEVKPQTQARYDDNFYRGKSDMKFQTPQARAEDNFFKPRIDENGLSKSFEKMSVNTQFASRSLKQHLNLGPQKKNPNWTDNTNPEIKDSSEVPWKVGDTCMAVYWEDQRLYEVNIMAVTDKTCVVKFKGYGNVEEVLIKDCFPKGKESNRKPNYNNSGPMEFRRNTRTFRRQ